MGKQKTKYGYTPQKVDYKVFIFALIPLASAFLYVLSLALMWTVDFPGTKIPLLYPMDFFSIVGLLVYLGFMFLWGWIGTRCAKSGIVFWKLLIGVNIVPILAALLYYVGLIIQGSEGIKDSIFEVIGASGCGFASYTGTMLYYIVSVEFINYIEVGLDLAFMLGVFAIGYSIGVSKKKTTKNSK